jgi:DNA-binding response OmpR family regulator
MPGTGQKILVVDDDLDTVNLLRLVLQRAGFRVSTATSWEEIIDRVKVAEEYRDTFDLILLDVMMPGRSGFEVMLVLQVVLHPVPPVIFLSAKCGMDDMVKASEMGAAKYLTKPTTPDKLLLAVNEVLSHNHVRRLS